MRNSNRWAVLLKHTNIIQNKTSTGGKIPVVLRYETTSESTAHGSGPAAPERAGRGVATAVSVTVESVEPAAVMPAWSARPAPPTVPQPPTL